MMEKCNIQGTDIDLPIDLIENPEIFSNVLSLDTWKYVLTPDDRKHLKKFLPVLPTDYPHAQEENLRSLFGGENFKFGNPLETFQKKLQAGLYTSDIVNYRRRCQTAKIKEYKLRLKKFYRKLVNDVLLSRQEIIDQVISNARQDTPITLSWNERRSHRSAFLSGNLDTKYKKVIKEVKDECEDQGISSDDDASDMNTGQQFVFNGTNIPQEVYVSESRDSVASTPAAVSTPGTRLVVTDEDYHRMLQSHKRKRLSREAFPELDTEAITLEDIISRTNMTARRSSKAGVKRKYKVKEKREQKKKFKKKRTVSNVVPKPLPPSPPPASAPVVETPELSEPVVELSRTADVKSYTSTENGCPCFFSLLRDIFLDLPDATAELDQLERMVAEWQQSSSFAASPWSMKQHSWIDLIPSALKFLAGSGNDVSNCPSYIPMVIFKQKVHQWKWIGTFRDKDTDLVPLFEHWLENKDTVTSNAQTSVITTLPRTEYVVAPSTPNEKIEYRMQERERYENPHKPFIYKMHGFESIVAPVKGVFTKESNLNKAREHSLLVSYRPPYVTILTLVRDAAARLPNGEGTRAEVCLLLKDSQYINPTATDGQIHTVVSGALDRLHYEKDPCVKYDNARKVWIYLHKTRTLEEFEKLHEASAAAARAKKQQNQKQKLLKQQQKAKEAATANPDMALSSTATGEVEGTMMSVVVSNVALPDASRAKKPAKPKRPPSANPKKQEKTKAKPKLESLDVTGHSLPTIVQPSLLPLPNIDILPSIPPQHSLQATISIEQFNTQDRNILHNLQPGSNFQRMSRLNSPYPPVGQPVPENPSPGYGVDLNLATGGVPQDSGSSSSGDSESESESSDAEHGISPGTSLSQHQDPSLQYSEQRIPFNNVMSLFQNNADDTDRGNSFGGY